MVAIRRNPTPSAIAHDDAKELPRANTPARDENTKKDTFAKGATVALGLASAGIGLLSGCATVGMAAPAVPLSPQEAQAKWEAFKADVAELNANPDGKSYTELVAARKALYQAYLAGGGSIGVDTDKDADGLDLAKELLFGTDDAKMDTDGDKMSDGYELSVGLDPADAQASAKADVAGWTHGYIPMSHNPMIEGDGLLHYDLLMKDRTGKDPAMRHIEGRSALDGGHYFLSSTLSEKDAEMTTGIDYNGDGVLTPGVEHDFLKPGAGEARFGSDGKTDLTLSVGWWGHCNDVATAGINFKEPTKAVEYELSQPFTRYTVSTSEGTFHAEKVTKGATHTDIALLSGQTVRLKNEDVTSTAKKEISKITFSADQVKELLSELVHRGSKDGTEFIGSRFYGRDATVKLEDGTSLVGGLTSSLSDRSDITDGAHTTATNFTKDITLRVFNYDSGTYENKTLKAADIQSVKAENKRDVAPTTFHETMLKWIGSDGKAGVMDKDAGTHVWNYSFDKYEMVATPKADDANTVDYEMKVYFSGNSYPTTYNYSITYEDGQPTGGKWADSSPNPDFFWREKGGEAAYDHTPGWGKKVTPVSYDVVMEIYKKSID